MQVQGAAQHLRINDRRVRDCDGSAGEHAACEERACTMGACRWWWEAPTSRAHAGRLHHLKLAARREAGRIKEVASECTFN